MLVNMNSELKSSKLTSLVISEMLEDDGISKFGVEEYISDGVLIARANEAMDTRTFKVRKMRTIKHSLTSKMLEFNENGVYVKHMEKKGLI